MDKYLFCALKVTETLMNELQTFNKAATDITVTLRVLPDPP